MKFSLGYWTHPYWQMAARFCLAHEDWPYMMEQMFVEVNIEYGE